MKKVVIIPILFFVFLLNIAGMCCNDDSIPTVAAKDAAPVINMVNKGTWKIIYFFDDNYNKTSLFLGNSFVFDSNNVLTVNTNATSYSGSWSVLQSVVVDDNPNNDLSFSISFSSPDNLLRLTNNWDVFERTETRLILRDINGGNGGIDYLTFQKN